MAIINATGDPNDAPGAGFKPIPEGMFDLHISSKESKPGKKGPQTKISAEIRAADAHPDEVGRKVTMWMSHDRAADLRQLLDACGVAWVPTTGPAGAGLQFDDDHLIGRYFRARMEHSPRDKGGVFENWRECQPSRFSPQPGATQAAGSVGAPAAGVAAPPAFQPPVAQQGVVPGQPVQQVAPVAAPYVAPQPGLPVQQQAAPQAQVPVQAAPPAAAPYIPPQS